MIALIKQVGQTLHVTEILFFRQMVMLLIAAPAIARGFPGALITKRLSLQATRLFFAFFAMVLGFASVIHLPLAEATTLNFAKTFFVSILAIVFLGEVVGLRRWGAIIVGFAGVVIVAWPFGAEGDAQFNIYSLMAIIAAACVAVVMIALRKLSQIDKPITILSYQAIGIGLLMIPPTIWFWKTPTVDEIILLGAIGAISFVAQYCNIQAYKAAEASALAPLDYARLVFALLLGYLMFNEWPEPRVFIGAILIVGAAIYTLHRERIRGQQIASAKEAKASGDS